MPKRTSRDVNEIAKSLVDQIAELTGESSEKPTKNPAAVALGKLGGLKGGPARARSLTPKKRAAIARKAARTRWKRKK